MIIDTPPPKLVEPGYAIVSTYNTSGKFIATYKAPATDIPFYKADYPNTVDGEFTDAAHYALNGVATLRPSFSPMPIADKLTLIANATDVVNVSNIPVGARVTLTGPGTFHAVTGDGTIITLSFAIPGEYKFLIEQFPQLPVTVIVNAT
jgi:hypothetical protein